jgi:hypothetical protein
VGQEKEKPPGGCSTGRRYLHRPQRDQSGLIYRRCNHRETKIARKRQNVNTFEVGLSIFGPCKPIFCDQPSPKWATPPARSLWAAGRPPGKRGAARTGGQRDRGAAAQQLLPSPGKGGTENRAALRGVWPGPHKPPKGAPRTSLTEPPSNPGGRQTNPPGVTPTNRKTDGAGQGRRAERGAGRTQRNRQPQHRADNRRAGATTAGRSRKGSRGVCLSGLWGASRRRGPAKRREGTRVPIKKRAGLPPFCWPSFYRSVALHRSFGLRCGSSTGKKRASRAAFQLFRIPPRVEGPSR